MIDEQLYEIFSALDFNNKRILPSDWAERNIILDRSVSSIQGRFNYDLTPYLREVVNRLDQDDNSRMIAIMKGAQIGFTSGVIVPGICWKIAHNPGNIVSLSANDALSAKMVEQRLDPVIRSSGIHHLIRPSVIRKRNQRTGDTSKSKEFAGGSAFFGGLQSYDNMGKQMSFETGFFDDWDAAKVSDKEQGNTFELVEQRFAASANTQKMFFISTPETRPSNIELLFKMGDQRKWMLPCPCCGAYIEIIWYDIKDGQRVGIVFDKDETGKLIESSVGYVCQECGGFFKEKHKYEMNLNAKWIPQAEPFRPGYVSYHITSLTAAPHMSGWTDYAYKWLRIYDDETESVPKLKVFQNVVLGQPWEERYNEIKEGALIRNTRNYEIGQVPNAMSKKDGNGDIILLTMACDLNGTIDDARLDYEVLAHAINGTTYSIDHGSIGTYQTKKDKAGRDLWTYRNEQHNNVWDKLWNDVISKDYQTDDGGIRRILIAGIDTGYMEQFAFNFIDLHPGVCYGLKGDGKDEYFKVGKDVAPFKLSKEKNNLYILNVNQIKDRLSERMALQWSADSENVQPVGFMNFPSPGDGKYNQNSYFVQFESEQRVHKTNDAGDVVGFCWKKKAGANNHFFDCRGYNMALSEIIAKLLCKQVGIQNGGWADFANIAKKVLEQ